MDKTLRNVLIIGILLVGVSLAYYFIIRPIQEKRAYSECFVALTNTGMFEGAKSIADKNFQIESCMKGNGAERIQQESQLRKEKMSAFIQAQEEKRTIDFSKVMISNFKLESTPDRYNPGNRFTITGAIKNMNDYGVRAMVVNIQFFDESGNKIDEHSEEITNSVFAHSETDFKDMFDMYRVDPNSNFKYTFELVEGQKM